MTKKAVKEVLSIEGFVDVTKHLNKEMKKALRPCNGHIFVCTSKDAWVKAKLAEYSAEEIEENLSNNHDEFMQQLFGDYFAITYAVTPDDPEGSAPPEMEGMTIVFAEDFYNDPQDIFDAIKAGDWFLTALLWHEIGHVIHHTGNEEIADNEAFTRMQMSKEEQIKFFRELNRFAEELGHPYDPEVDIRYGYAHRAKALGYC